MPLTVWCPLFGGDISAGSDGIAPQGRGKAGRRLQGDDVTGHFAPGGVQGDLDGSDRAGLNSQDIVLQWGAPKVRFNVDCGLAMRQP